MVVNFPNADWLSYSENPVEGVCGRSLFAKQEILLGAVFSNKLFRSKQTLKKVKGTQIWTVARLTNEK